MDREHARRIYGILERLYMEPGSPRTFLSFDNPYQILVMTILSARTTDRSVNAIKDRLFSRYPRPADLAAADPRELEEIIRPLGFYREKARRLIGTARALVGRFGGEVPRTMDDLLSLPGVGRKTANIVLDHAFGVHEGVAVDTHVARLSRRLGFTRRRDPAGIERDLMALFPRDTWGNLNYLLIRHGRAVCTARNPSCATCPLGHLCPSRGTAGTGEASKESREVQGDE
ncbi:MAG: endonuclease III [Methanolinea sp.]|nr:endonuclease III [Methanolinea sp.]